MRFSSRLFVQLLGPSMMPSSQETGKSTEELAVLRFSTEYMDPSVSPHSNFYDYAAGAWLRNTQIPPDKSHWNTFDMLLERNLILLKEILEESAGALEPSQPGSPKRLVGDFYRAAMDHDLIEDLGFKPILDLLGRIKEIGIGEKFGTLLGELRNSGIDVLFQSYSAADMKNSSTYTFYLHQGGISLPDREYYLADSFAEMRKKYAVHVGRMLALDGEPQDKVKHLASVVLEFETTLAKSSRSRTDLRDDEKNYNRIKVSDLDGRFPSIYLSTFLETSQVPKQTEFVIIGQPEFFETLSLLLSKKSKEDVQAFLAWRVIHSLAPYLHSAVEAEDFAFFHKTLLGQQEPQARWKRASVIINDLLGEALGSLYVEKHFSSESKRRVSLLVEDLQAVFRKRLANLPWMAEGTRRQALSKFKLFRVKIGYPDLYRDYSSVIIDPKDYVGNVRRASEFEALRQARRVGQPVDKSEWLMTPPTVDAYFHPMENTINFPAGILQPPFFDVGLDDAVNYGGIGAVIGHEITHGYDDQGRRFDAEGNLRDWWTPQDEQEFKIRAKAVVELYSSRQPLPGKYVNGELTLGENIADFGGVSLAYEALQMRLEREPHKRKLIDGLSPEQRFFISWSQIWREKIREEEILRMLTINPHSPDCFRATLPAIYHEGFDLAFPLTQEEQEVERKREKVSVW